MNATLLIACPSCGALAGTQCANTSRAHAARRKAAPVPAAVRRSGCRACGRLVSVSKPGRLDYHDRAQNQLCPGSDTEITP